jgi:cysteine desulfurase
MDLSHIADDVDLLSLSAHKMYGPQGVGALFIRRELQERIEPLIYGGGQQDGIRSGTLPVPLCVGMGAAAEFMDQFGDSKRAELRKKRDSFVTALQELPWGLTVNGAAASDRHPGNANLQFHGFSAFDILNTLQPNLAASTGSACTSGIAEPSHVLKAIGLTTSEAESSIRFSLGFETTDAEISRAMELVRDTLERLSAASFSASA